ncbi:hypothetical protein Pcinc_004710 [Petrolisthes cinctipes]|uniref:Uncharacterized protein n=1 Tax=Petrolisthes cinctipes TaxID=88211 RepID=A0AAE1KZV3_PETCI|nr:hypothetical protein Pcinc_004710 [Petrolisthes cinctipes]
MEGRTPAVHHPHWLHSREKELLYLHLPLILTSTESDLTLAGALPNDLRSPPPPPPRTHTREAKGRGNPILTDQMWQNCLGQLPHLQLPVS